MNKEQGNKYRAQSWLGIWGMADRIVGTSGQLEHVQRHESFLSFGLLTWHSEQ